MDAGEFDRKRCFSSIIPRQYNSAIGLKCRSLEIHLFYLLRLKHSWIRWRVC